MRRVGILHCTIGCRPCIEKSETLSAYLAAECAHARVVKNKRLQAEASG